MQSTKAQLGGIAADFVRRGSGGVRFAEPHIGPVSREEIARAAYFRAEARGFRPGSELDDWLAAERELDPMGRTGRRR